MSPFEKHLEAHTEALKAAKVKTLGPADFAKIVEEAEIAGREAGCKCRPHPMVVFTPDGKGNIDYTKPVYHVDDGACGFAWVNFKGNTKFGKWMKAAGKARSAYPTGLCVWVSEFGQSVERKEAYAAAYAKVLKSYGIDCYSASRLD